MTVYSDVGTVNTPVVRTFPAAAYTRYQLTQVVISWSGTAPTIGLLTITDNGVTVWSEDIPLALNNPFTLNTNIVSSTSNQPLVVTVAAGGAGSVAKLDTTVTSLTF